MLTKEKITTNAILLDIGALFISIMIPIFILLQVIKGINEFESLSTQWWMVIALILVMLNSRFMGLHELDRFKKYLQPVIKALMTRGIIKC